jgi:plasmid replication initiation protein
MNYDKHKNILVTKHKNLLNGRFKLNQLSLKIIAILISMVHKNDVDFKEYKIKVSDFKDITGTNSKRIYEYLKDSSEELLSNPLHIKGENDSWIKVNWIASAKYESGVISYRISPELRPYLLDLQNKFLQYNLKNILNLQGNYVIRLYEILKDSFNEQSSYKDIVEKEIEIEWLKKIFELPKSYQYSSHIKKNIIEKAQKQFKEKTDIEFSFIESKKGKKTTKIIFKIQENKNNTNFLSSRKTFINFIRKEYINKDIIETKDIYTQNTILLSISPAGKLYDKRGQYISSKRSEEIYSSLYDLAKNNKKFAEQLFFKKSV